MTAEARLRELALASGPRLVTAGHPAAAAAGVAAYAAGGNAFDAALAACFAEHVALPMKCGLAGDLVSIFRRSDGTVRTLVSVGGGALALGEGARMQRLGPCSVGVPGAPDGFATLHGFARLPLATIAAPALRMAETGVAWSRVGINYLRDSVALLERYSPGNPYLAGGMPKAGDLLRLPGLGALLRAFIRDGADLFAGEEGERVVAAVRAGGGFLSVEDLRRRHARLAPPLEATLPDGTVLRATPAPTGGPRLAAIVAEACGRPEALLPVIRAERLEAKRRGRLATDGGTSVVTAADAEGNAVVVVHSNSFPRFGSGVVLPSGLVLSNRPGRGFDLEAPPAAANAPAPGRVPLTTLHAWSLARDGELLLGATPGGINQLPWNAQSVLQLLAGPAGGADIAATVTSPRWALSEADELTAEPGAVLPAEAGARPVAAFANGSAQQIIHLRPGRLPESAADPRSIALALAAY